VEREEEQRERALAERVAPHGGEHADRHGDEVREEDRRERERRRHGQASQDLLADWNGRPAVLAAEVEREEPVPRPRAAPAEARVALRREIVGSEEVQVLLPQRLVEQVLRRGTARLRASSSRPPSADSELAELTSPRSRAPRARQRRRAA
jgi:hypothetical protein